MLVDVIRLRREGIKLPRDAVLAAVPVRGRLTIAPSKQGYSGGPAKTIYDAHLSAGNDPNESQLLPSLHKARVTRIQGNALFVAGEERVGRFGTPPGYPQGWWCQMVRDL